MAFLEKELFWKQERLVLTLQTQSPKERSLTALQQVHSAIYKEISPDSHGLSADAFIGESCTVPISIKTADCLPILALGSEGIALIHAGHRGLSENILGKQHLSKIRPYYFFIGPHIKQCCFKVSPGFEKKFSEGQRYYNSEKETFSLTHLARDILTEFFSNSLIEFHKSCTFCSPLRLPSYRRDKTEQRIFTTLKRRPK